MPRKRKLDKYVSSFVDRHGVERFRFRRAGVSRYLPPPGTDEYKRAYAEALTGVIGLDRVKPGTVNDLAARYYQSVGFRTISKSWQSTLRQHIESFRAEAGNQLVSDYRPRHLNASIARRLEQGVDERGKRVGGTSAAKRFREVMQRLFAFAVREEMIGSNPADLTDAVSHKTKGYYTWTEGDIRQYRERWALGTMARLALELMLWTGMRRGNAHKAPPPVNGRFVVVAVKTGEEFEAVVTPQLQAAIDAMPEGAKGEALIVNSFGKPFTAAGFGNKMREWCDAAGLPNCTSHGLRKALATRAADLGLSQQELKALGQWRGDEEVRTYTEKANRKRLAERAAGAVSDAEQAGNIG